MKHLSNPSGRYRGALTKSWGGKAVTQNNNLPPVRKSNTYNLYFVSLIILMNVLTPNPEASQHPESVRGTGGANPTVQGCPP